MKLSPHLLHPKALLALALFSLSQLVLAGPRIEHWTTPTGTPVYFVASPNLPMLDVRIDFAAGSAYDPTDKAGLASLTHALLDLGAGPDDEATIARKLADLGAQLSGGVELDRASVSLRTLTDPERLPAAMALLRQVLSAPHFSETVLQRERQRAIAELNDALTRPDTLANRAFWQTLYGTHPYGQQTDEASLTRINRADLVAFFQRHYTRNNAIITLIGDLDRAHAEKMADKLSRALLEDTGVPRLSTTLPTAPASTGQTVRIKHPASQAHVLLGLPLVPRGDPDFFPLLVGNYTLGGGGFVSRLMHEVREKRGYAYSVYSYFAPMKVAGPFQIGLQTKKEQADAALQLTREVVERFVAEGPSAAELVAAKANLAGSFPLRLDSNRKLLDNVATLAFYGLPLDWLDTYQARIRAVSRESVRQAFARHLPPAQLNTIVVGAE